MSLIRYSLLAAIMLYIGIFLIEGSVAPPVLLASIIGIVLLLALISTLFVRDEERLRKTEMILVWCCVLAYAVYGLIRAGGLV